MYLVTSRLHRLHHRINHISYRSLTLVVVLLLIGIIALGKLLLTPRTAKADWWSDIWRYRAPVTLTNSGSSLSDYQIKFYLNTQALISAGKMKSDCTDIRVVYNGEVVPYWVEDNCNAASTSVWARLPSVPSGNSTIYAYYGNSSAGYDSSPSQVFDYYDDFNSGGLGVGWSSTSATAVWTEANGVLSQSNTTSLEGKKMVRSAPNGLTSYVIETRVRPDSFGADRRMGLAAHVSPISQTPGYNLVFRDQISFPHDICMLDDAVTWGGCIGVGATHTVGNWYKFKFAISNYADASSLNHQKGKIWRFGTGATEPVTYAFDTTQSDKLDYLIGFNGGYNSTVSFDDFFVHKYAITEPTASVSSEESVVSPLLYYSFDEGGGNVVHNQLENNSEAGLVAWWKMDENSGTTLNDVTGNNPLTFAAGTSAPAWAAAKIGTGISINGTNQYAYKTSAPNLVLTGSFSYEGWIYRKADSGNYERIYSRSDTANGYDAWMQIMTDDTLSCGVIKTDLTSYSINSSVTIPLNTWTHVACSLDTSAGFKIYVNGKDQSGLPTGTIGPARGLSQTVNLGRLNAVGAQYFSLNGIIDSFKIYNRALPPDQIAADYATLQANTISSPSWQDGAFSKSSDVPLGKSLLFNGTNQYAEIPDSSRINFVSKPFSVSLWFNKASNFGATYKRLYDKSQVGTGNGYGIDINDTNIRLLGSTIYTTPYTFTNNTWYHLVVTYDGATTGQIYLNGRLIDSGTYAAINAWVSPAHLASDSSFGSLFNGRIDEFKLYNQVIPASQVSLEYNRGRKIVIGNAKRSSDPGSTGLIAWYKFDDGTPNSFTDSSGNNFNGTFGVGASSPSRLTGKFGDALNFTAAGQVASIPDNAAFASNYMTVSAWINPRTYTNGSIFNRRTAANVGGNTFEISAGLLRCYYYISGAWNSITAPAPPLNTWTHVACSYDGSRISLYVNSINVGSSAISGTINSPASPLIQIGNNIPNPTISWDGLLDNIKIYNRGLSAIEISHEFNQGSPLVSYNFNEGHSSTVYNQMGATSETGLVTWWKMDENAGVNTFDAMANVDAAFGPGTSAPTWATGKIGTGINFNGSNQFATVPPTASLDLQRFAISTWLYSTNFAQNGFIFEKTANGAVNTQYSCFLEAANGIVFRTYNSSGVMDNLYSTLANAGVTNSQWNHLICSYDGAYKKIYVNGRQVASAPYNQTLAANPAGGSVIGAYAYSGTHNYFFNGIIDSLKIYSHGLTPDQALSEYSSLDFNILKTTASPNTYYWQAGAAANSSQSPAGRSLYLQNVYGYAPAQTILPSGTAPFSVSVWIKPSSTITNNGSYVYFWGAQSTANANVIAMDTTNHRIWHDFWSRALYSPNNSVPDNTWTHLGVTYNGSLRKLYINGRLVGSDTPAGVSVTNNTVFVINSNNAGNGAIFNGNLDEFKVYAYPLTDTEMATEFNISSALRLGSGQLPNNPALDVGLTSALINWYKFDEGSGNNAWDNSGLANTLHLSAGSSSPAWDAGYIGKSLSCNTNDYVAFSTQNIDTTVGAQNTVTFWMKWKGTDMVMPFSFANYDLFFWTNRFGFNTGNSDILYTPADNLVNRWVYVAAVFNNSAPANNELYIDGIKKALTLSGAQLNRSVGASASLCGYYPGNAGYYFNGNIDNLKIFKRKLTPAEINYEYNQGKPLHYFRFDEKSGATANNNGNRSVPPDGLVAYWPMEGVISSGSTFTIDASGNNLNIAYSGAAMPSVPAGIREGSVNLQNSVAPQFFYCADAVCGPYLDYQGKGFTFEAWIKGNGTQNSKTIVSKTFYSSATSNGGWVINTDAGGVIHFILRNSNGSPNLADLSAATYTASASWNHIAATYDGLTAKLYYNGNQIASTNYSGGIEDVTTIFTLGGVTGSLFDGYLDDVKVYQRALSAADISLEYTNPSNPAYLINFPTNGSQWIQGKYGNALNFDGTNDDIIFNLPEAINTGAGTVSAWIKPNGTQTSSIFNHTASNSNIFLTLGPSSLNANCVLGTGVTIGTYTLPDQTWSHLACTWNGTTAAFYVNGVNRTTTSTITAFTNTGPIWIGSNNAGTANYKGAIDELKIFGYALNSTQIQTEYSTNGAAVRF